MQWRERWTFFAVAGLVLARAGGAGADLTTERSASILVFPKLIADGTRDTRVMIVNTGNSLARAHCFYVNASLTDPTADPGPLNPPLWQEVDFDISLTRQQPTSWSVSEGRDLNPLDEPCSPQQAILDCDNAGFDPGHIPPVVRDFVGELKCIEVDDSGAPMSGNHFLGTATLSTNPEVDSRAPVILQGISKYNALGILGDENNGDPILVLGGGQCAQSAAICSNDDDCGGDGPCVPEYNACPQTWILNHLADGAPNLALERTDFPDLGGNTSSVETELTIVPCTQNFETQIPTTVTIQFVTTNEYELQFSVSTSVTCWGNFRLGDTGATALTFAGQVLPDPQGTMYLQTRMRSAAGTPFGLLMVAEEFHAARSSIRLIFGEVQFATPAAVNLHVEGERPVPDLITLPAEQVEP